MTSTRGWFFDPLLRCAGCVLVLLVVLSLRAHAQEGGSSSGAAASPSTSVGQEPKKDQSEQEQRERHNPGVAAQLARETREAAGEDDTGQFKSSPSVVFLANITRLDLKHAYWLAVGLNFAVIAGILFWAGRKFLPGAFRARTAAIQRAMEEARRASEDANRRLSEIESRLAKLGDEIAAMKAASDADLAAEEARIKAAAEEDARKIVESAEQEIEAAAKAARRDLTTYAADLAISLAKKQIHVDAGTDSSLVRSFADRLGNAEDGGKN